MINARIYLMNILIYWPRARVGPTIRSPQDKGASSDHTHLASQASPFPPRQRSTRPHSLATERSSAKNIFFAITNVMRKPNLALYSCCVVSRGDVTRERGTSWPWAQEQVRAGHGEEKNYKFRCSGPSYHTWADNHIWQPDVKTLDL